MNRIKYILKRTPIFLRLYWREIVVLIMFLYLQAGINEAKNNAEYAYDYAADASHYARNAWDSADEASDNASNAVSVCEDAYYYR